MIDLHTHTNLSDGTDDVKTLLTKAEEAGVECLSITDHNDCRAYEVLSQINVGEYYTGRIVPGCEFKVWLDGVSIEILGYKVNMEVLSKRIPELYISYEERQRIEYDRLAEICKRLGLKFNEEEIAPDFKEDYGMYFVHHELVKYPENRKHFSSQEAWDNRSVFYRACLCNPNDVFYMDNSDNQPSVEEVIDLIKEAGGLAFMAHVYLYWELSDRLFKTLMSTYPIDGVECCYWAYSDQQTQFLVDFCKKNNLYMSGGSDYHGGSHKENAIGKGLGNLNISFELIADWVDK